MNRLFPAGLAAELVTTVVARIHRNRAAFGDRFPSYGDGATRYLLTPNKNWLASFWAGLQWLTYATTREQRDRDAAAALLPTFAARLDDNIHLNHDLGFLFILSARAQYLFTGDTAARALALRAADALFERYHPHGRYIQAWGDVSDPEERGRFIIDCMMNLGLLFWASAETGDSRYRDAALNHAATTQRYLLREDGSTYHTFFLDPETASPIGPKTHQGYADDSLWARGQAWAVFGFAVAAQWSGEPSFLASAEAAADCYLSAAPLNTVAPWDLALPDSAPNYPDSSADAITAAGLLRLAALTDSAHYRAQAYRLLLMLYEQAFDIRPEAQGLLLHGTQHVPSGYGIDTYTIFGDYFFFESILNMTEQAPDFWGVSPQ